MVLQMYPKLQQVVFWEEINDTQWLYLRPEATQTRPEQGNNAEAQAGINEGHRSGSEDTSGQGIDYGETIERSGTLYRELKLPVERMWGKMWWTFFEF